MVDGQQKESQDVAAPRLPMEGKLNGLAPAAERMLQPLDEVTLAAAAARYASRLVSTTVPADLAGAAASRPREQERSRDTPQLERPPAACAKAMDEYRTKALELINANLNTSLEYAWRLASAKSPAEFVELSTNYACGHFELIMTLRLHLARCPVF
jgi:Phasin protein